MGSVCNNGHKTVGGISWEPDWSVFNQNRRNTKPFQVSERIWAVIIAVYIVFNPVSEKMVSQVEGQMVCHYSASSYILVIRA